MAIGIWRSISQVVPYSQISLGKPTMMELAGKVHSIEIYF